MFIYVYKPGDPPAATFSVEPETTFGQFKEIVGGAFGVNPGVVTLTRNGQGLAGGDGESLKAIGLNNKDLLSIVG